MDLSYCTTKIQTNFVQCLIKFDKQVGFIYKKLFPRSKILANNVKKQLSCSFLVVYFDGSRPYLIVNVLTIFAMFRQFILYKV